MRFLTDECCHADIVTGLRADGHDVLAATEVLRRSPDPSLLDVACREGRILITEDSDFGTLVVQHRLASRGILYLRLGAAVGPRKLARVREVIAARGDELSHNLVVVEPDRERLHPLSDDLP